jgi:tagatose 6-phosphate kinase
MILCIGATPAVQRVMVFRKLALDHVNRAGTTLEGAAGKSINVAKVLKALGEKPVATGFLGGDRGEFLRGVLEEKGIQTDFVTVSARTRQCLTVVDAASGTQTELIEESVAVRPVDYQRLIQIVRRRLQLRVARTFRAPTAVVMSGTITPGGPVKLYFECTKLARAAGAMAVVDAKGAPLLEALKARPSLVKPNVAELAATVGRELKNEKDVKCAMCLLGERGAERVVVTSGKKPALAFDGRSYWKIFNPLIKAVNPIGSGDAFTAGLVWRLVRGDDLGEACRWGAASGAANALTLMAGEVNRKDVERLARRVEVDRV